MKNSGETGYNGIYLERGGVQMRIMVESLTEQPEFELSPEETSEVRQFANESIHKMPIEMTDGGDEDEVEPLTLEKVIINNGLSKTGMIFGGGLTGEQGRQTAAALNCQIPILNTPAEAYQWLASSVSNKTIDEHTLEKLSKATLDRYKKMMTESLLDGSVVNAVDLDMMHINFTPERTMKSAEELQAARKQLLIYRRDYGASELIVDGAKRAIIDVYLAKLNNAIVNNIDRLLMIYDQAKLLENDAEMERSRSLLGGFGKIVDMPETSSRILTRFDYMRNGMGTDESGAASAISAQLERTLGMSDPEVVDGYFTPEQVGVLRGTLISVERMREGFEKILSEAGVLSSEDASTWKSKRGKRAFDEKFQVVEQPTLTTYAVDGIDGVYKVPSQPRSLYDTIVVGGFHEAAHIDQCLADDEFAKVFSIGKIKGKRAGSLREPAANAIQRKAEKRLFGASKPISSPTYVNALKAKAQGGSLADMARAFFVTKLSIMPDIAARTAAVEAADRVLRLERHHGYNSQPLAYAEEGVMVSELEGAPTAVAQRAGAITTLDLVDQLRLHRYGLLPTETLPAHDWAGLVFKEFSADIEQALQDAGFPADMALTISEDVS